MGANGRHPGGNGVLKPQVQSLAALGYGRNSALLLTQEEASRIIKALKLRKKGIAADVIAPPAKPEPVALTDGQKWYAAYLKTPHWKNISAATLEYAGHRCQVCNSRTSVQVHHRTYERVGREEPADLTALCAKCHSLFHARMSVVERD